MSENSKIEWTDHTFNPWMGCTKVSEGCANCYAETLMDKRYGKVQWGPQGTRVRTSEANWKKPLTWNKRASGFVACSDCGWRGTKEESPQKTCPVCSGHNLNNARQRVFCASLADVFEDRPEFEEWRKDLFKLIVYTPNLDWLLLTKRPENVVRLSAFELIAVLPNVWIGTSVENQEQADKRIPELLKIPAANRFLSIEPLLGAVDLTKIVLSKSEIESKPDLSFDALMGWHGGSEPNGRTYLDWVIVGGESGSNARPMHPYWVRSIRDQCLDAGVPFFFKQWGKWAPDCLCDTKKAHDTIHRPGESLSVMFACGKKRAGRQLDGREWNEMPGGQHDQR